VSQPFMREVQEEREVWYRVEDGRYAPMLDEYERPVGEGRSWVSLHEVPVIRRTPKGAWLNAGRPRFVLLESRKRYACPTPEEAWESWRKRKERQLIILRSQLDHVTEALSLAVEVRRAASEPLPF
jgi:hypothetical protein